RLRGAAVGSAGRVLTRSSGMFLSIAWRSGGRRLAAAGGNDLELWDVRRGEPVLALPSRELPPSLAAVAFSPDGQVLAVGGGGLFISLWDCSTGQKVRNLSLYTRTEPVPGLSHIVTSLSFRPDGVRLASCCGASAVTG